MNNREFEEMWKNLQEDVRQIELSQEKYIRDLYRNCAKSVRDKLKSVNPDTLTYRQLELMAEELGEAHKKLNADIRKKAKENQLKAAQKVDSVQMSIYEAMADKHALKVSESWRAIFGVIHHDVIALIGKGGLYVDGKGLAARLYKDHKKFKKDIATVLKEGVALKKSAYEIAKDLEKYVNPKAAKPWDWGKVYPGTKRVIDYNAQRLARTAVTHAYHQATIESCKKNPYISSIQWRSAFAHGRTCSICMDRDGNIYKLDEVPLEHPNGLCTLIPVLDKSLTEISEEVKEWKNGGENKVLDEIFD